MPISLRLLKGKFMAYYGTRNDFGCRFGEPHDMRRVHEGKQVIVERCARCMKTFRWGKGFKGRIANAEYLRAHIRAFAQRFGATKRIFNKLYEPQKAVIHL